MTLCYAFLFSFAGVGDATSWPLIWIAFALAYLFEPLPFLLKRVRWWITRYTGRLLASGTKRVEVSCTSSSWLLTCD